MTVEKARSTLLVNCVALHNAAFNNVPFCFGKTNVADEEQVFTTVAVIKVGLLL